MPDTPASLHNASDGGVAGSHSAVADAHILVGPSTAAEKNLVTAGLFPVGCWRVDDVRFEFDSSFVLPAIANEIQALATLRDLHKKPVAPRTNPSMPQFIFPPMSIFGHADPVGNDDYNKILSGRRAAAIYGLLTRRTDVWEDLFSNHGNFAAPAAGDKWGDSALRTMQSTTALPADTSRPTLFRAYMDALCTLKSPDGKPLLDAKGQPVQLTLDPTDDFLARQQDSLGKGDFQGCSEFNPLLIFSQQKNNEFDADKDKSKRNLENAPNRRVLVLLFRPGSKVLSSKWPCPRAKEGVDGCIKRFWSDGNTRRSRRLPDDDRAFEDTNDTFACRFYQRLITGSPCEKVVPVLPATLEIILDQDNGFTVDASEPAAKFVRMGIWDHAFDAATANLFNNAADAQNFIGKDSLGKEARRFYFRVKDPNAKGKAEIRVDWRTEFEAGGNIDAPASQAITLLPIADTDVFVSHAVFLVSDAVDQAQTTDSGLAAPNPDAGKRTQGQSNHRIRKVTVDESHRFDAKVVAEYTAVAGGAVVNVTIPLFNRAPEERLKIKVHLVNVRSTAGGAGVLTAARKQTAIDTLRSVYARCGIFLEIDEIVIDPPAACINWSTRYPTSPLAIGADPAVESAGFPSGNLVPSTSQSAIINLIRARPDFDQNDLYLVYVTKIFNDPVPPPPGGPGKLLQPGPGGIAFPDSFTAAGSIARSFVFIGLQTVNALADPHEMTHVTTNLRNSAGGHFHLQANVNSGPGNIDGRNLMQRFALISNGNTSDSKRLWDEDFTNANLTPAKIPAQISAIRASRFVRPF